MLSQLFINNIAVIEKASIDFSSGLTVLTGETGAGKSIIIDAINAVLGERTSRELVRTGADSASVTALFTDVDASVLSYVKRQGYEPEDDGSLLIQREIKSEGKSLCRLNGSPITVTMLKQIGVKLISIHGQHESYDLLSPEVHINYIDSYAGIEPLLSEYKKVHKNLKDIQEKLESFNSDEGLKARQIDLLKYQIDEIVNAEISVGEEESLTADRDIIRNSEKIAEAVALASVKLNGNEIEGGVLSDIGEAASQLEGVADYSDVIAEALQKLREAEIILEDAESTLRNLNSDFDPNLLNDIEARLDEIYRLKLKYGDSEEKILAFLETAKTELHSIEFSDEERERLENEFEKVKENAISLAKEISRIRQQASLEFSQRVKEELRFLNMPGIEFLLDIERVPLYSNGCDKVQFMVSANKGEPAKPMSKIASGGELSRIMLAIKTVLAGKDRIETLIFDEIDNGISGEAGNKVGLKLLEVSKNRQVICITHLAQIAAYADNHLLISKSESDDRTYTKVAELSVDERRRELARIIGGDDISEARLQMADELLKKRLDF